MSKLNLVQLKRRARMTPQEVRRSKLIEKLEEQLALAQAQAEGKRYVALKPAWRTDENGVKSRVQREKNVRPWWWPEGTGLTLVIRYGSRPVELAKGRRAISVEHPPMLPGALNAVIAAVKAGELDAAIEAALAEVRGAAGKAR
ncbi:MAG: hypothetical protein Q7J52_21935 [Falsiroseomonas sp.]|nr:hypothetical protein [Falsiroseomonas sp.]